MTADSQAYLIMCAVIQRHLPKANEDSEGEGKKKRGKKKTTIRFQAAAGRFNRRCPVLTFF